MVRTMAKFVALTLMVILYAEVVDAIRQSETNASLFDEAPHTRSNSAKLVTGRVRYEQAMSALQTSVIASMKLAVETAQIYHLSLRFLAALVVALCLGCLCACLNTFLQTDNSQ